MKVEITYKNKGKPSCWAEVRFRPTKGGDCVCIVAGPEGFDWKWYKREADRWGRSTKGLHIHIGSNGPLQFTKDEWKEMLKVIENVEQEIKYTGVQI